MLFTEVGEDDLFLSQGGLQIFSCDQYSGNYHSKGHSVKNDYNKQKVNQLTITLGLPRQFPRVKTELPSITPGSSLL